MENSKILKRVYYAVDVTLKSPLCLSGGYSGMTDADVLVNSKGEPFVPGTSLAGAMRDFLGQEKDDDKGIFGYFKKNINDTDNNKNKEQDNGRMSSVFISDLYFDPPYKISIRDGIRLKEGDKTVSDKGKFDWQIVETGASGSFYLDYIVREGDRNREDDFEDQIAQVFRAIQDGSIRLGAKKTRGFGRLKINTIYKKEFWLDEDNKLYTGTKNKQENISISEWINFKKNAQNENKDLYYTKQTFNEWEEEQKEKESKNNKKYIWIHVPLKLTGGISIRKYSAEPKREDYEQITCNDVPVIPGTSWNGAIRADIHEMLISLGLKGSKANEIIRDWFGNVPVDAEEKEGEKAKQSKVIFGESILEDSTSMILTRNKINRFDSAPIEGALYTEKAYFGGKTGLDIMVRKESEDKIPGALIAALDFAIQDIQEGYIAVGGLTSIGRGVFEPDPDQESGEVMNNKKTYNFGDQGQSIRCSEPISIDDCRKDLYKLTQEGGDVV